MRLHSALLELKTSREKNVQLDLFRENGQVLLQLYKQSDVNNWGYNINLTDEKGLVLELSFNNAKQNNKYNFKRFKESIYIESFRTFPKVEQNSFFIGFSGHESVEYIVSHVLDIIKTVYELENFNFSINAY